MATAAISAALGVSGGGLAVSTLKGRLPLFDRVRPWTTRSQNTESPASQKTEQAIHAAKMTALGQMTAGIVHEINTPLAYVDASFLMLRRVLNELIADLRETKEFVGVDRFGAHTGPQADRQRLIDDVDTLLNDGLHGVEQISKLVSSLKNFSRLDADRTGEFSVTSILDDALFMTNHKLKYLAELVKNYNDVPHIHCAPSQIGQVFLNIINNAVQAFGDRIQDGRIAIDVEGYEKDKVCVRIADNGSGIPSHLVGRIFDPFFTTKPVGEGTGLGLSICYGIIRNHGGQILVDSERGLGTTFSIILPTRSMAA